MASIGGDPAREDINQVQFELEWRATRPSTDDAKATAKPVADWVGGQRSAAELELEAGWRLDPCWALALPAGGRRWGKGAPGTSSTPAELKLDDRY